LLALLLLAGVGLSGCGGLCAAEVVAIGRAPGAYEAALAAGGRYEVQRPSGLASPNVTIDGQALRSGDAAVRQFWYTPPGQPSLLVGDRVGYGGRAPPGKLDETVAALDAFLSNTTALGPGERHDAASRLARGETLTPAALPIDFTRVLASLDVTLPALPERDGPATYDDYDDPFGAWAGADGGNWTIVLGLAYVRASHDGKAGYAVAVGDWQTTRMTADHGVSREKALRDLRSSLASQGLPDVDPATGGLYVQPFCS
jgi:hypothetical protein